MGNERENHKPYTSHISCLCYNESTLKHSYTPLL